MSGLARQYNEWHQPAFRAELFHVNSLAFLDGIGPARERGIDHLAGPAVRGAHGPIHNRLRHVTEQQPAILFNIHVRRRLAKASDGSDILGHSSIPSDAINVSEGVDQVRTIVARNRTKEKIDITRGVRDAAIALVKREHMRTMSRMVAYQNVASTIGSSSSWLRKFVNDYPDVKPDVVVSFNILAYYACVCPPYNGGNQND